MKNNKRLIFNLLIILFSFAISHPSFAIGGGNLPPEQGFLPGGGGGGSGGIDPTDWDHDGKPAIHDNCPYKANFDQADSDGDGRGNVCDNCPQVANASQEDQDKNGIGDACEPPPSPKPIPGIGKLNLFNSNPKPNDPTPPPPPQPPQQVATEEYIVVHVPYKNKEAIRLMWHGLLAHQGYGVYEPGSWIQFYNRTVDLNDNPPTVKVDHTVHFKTWVRNGVLFLEPLVAQGEPEDLVRELKTSNDEKGMYDIIPNMPFMLSAPGSEFSVVRKNANNWEQPKIIEGEKLEYNVVGPLEIQIIIDPPSKSEECDPQGESGV